MSSINIRSFSGQECYYERNVIYKKCGVLKSNEDMILALAGQFKQLSHEPEIQVNQRDSNP